VRRRPFKSAVKVSGSTGGLPMILCGLSVDGVHGIYGVAVKCIDTIRNTDSEGIVLINN
jgi:hypothetical protein